MDIKKGRIIREDETLKYYSTAEENQLILHFKDDIPKALKLNKTTVKNKGKFNGAIAYSIFKYLESYHIPTHFEKQLSVTDMAVVNLDRFGFEILIWNYATGSLQKRFGLEKGKPLNCPIVEVYLKNEKLKDLMINSDHACALGYAKPEEIQTIDKLSRKTNAVLKSFFERRCLKLLDFTLSFGKFDNQIMIIDAITADNCSISDIQGKNRSPGTIFTDSDREVEDIYAEISERLGN